MSKLQQYYALPIKEKLDFIAYGFPGAVEIRQDQRRLWGKKHMLHAKINKQLSPQNTYNTKAQAGGF